MIQKIRKSKASKVIACYLALMLILEVIAPMQAFALTGGPSQPEFESFTPIGTSDMVDLSSGDFNYNIPIMDVGGYPINLAYNSGITMDQEASWVGLGWDLNVGQISRQMRGIPDDFDGDEMLYENNMKDNVSVGANFTTFAGIFGQHEHTDILKPSLGFGVKYNNYNGFTFTGNAGLSFDISDNLSVGMNMSASATEGATVAPFATFRILNLNNAKNSLGLNVGTALSSRRGIEDLAISAYISKTGLHHRGIGYGGISTGGIISFVNSSYTPTKRVGMTSSNYMFNLNLESEVWGIEPGVKFSGYRTSQGIKESEKKKTERAYGFENTYNATDKDILDFNREKDKNFSIYTTTLPITNNTYDIYSIQGQGIEGTFRPYKGQVGYIYDNHTDDDSNGSAGGVELGWGIGAHWGVNASVTIADSYTKVWRNTNPAIGNFEAKKTGNRPEYEKVFFKNIGGFHVDNEQALLDIKLGGYDPVRFGISSGNKFSRNTEPVYHKKTNLGSTNITTPIKREGRLARNQAIQKLSTIEARQYGFDTKFSRFAKDHHTAEIRVIKDGGERYVYGKAAYNTTKKEVTFDVSGIQANCKSGLVTYNPGSHNSIRNKANGDQYFNRVTTPAYAHSYLLTSVLSSDYSDLTNDGPTDDDLGSYTKFIYDDSKTQVSTYKWRVPYTQNAANYDEGLKTNRSDDKGSYTFGEKELIYIQKIETKTHVAVFNISVRKDGYGVNGENGGGSTSTPSRMYKLNKITLYSKPEYNSLGENATPIKVAHFVYDYSLATGVDNNFGETSLESNELQNQRGKLTLKKIFFTYRNSNMGKYTPYTFKYSSFNPAYNIKAYDAWGNYKQDNTIASCDINSPISNAEFPFVEQNKSTADQYSGAWLLQSVGLPSGGKIELQYESDDYKSVQDKDVMQMFKVTGVGKTSAPTTLAGVTNNILYMDRSDITNRIYVELNEQMTPGEFKKKYIRDIENENMYFRFLLNMSQPNSGNEDKYDYVTGYLQLDKGIEYQTFSIGGKYYASIPIKVVSKGDGFNSNSALVNPISKAGWQFGRQYLNRYVYSSATDESTDNIEEIVKEIINVVPAMFEILKSPNQQLVNRRIASRFIPAKSWIRLMQPEQKKFGGGSRVKEIKMHDQWQVMTQHESDDKYKQYYGQQYSYESADGKTSGVATYEPLGNKENPFVQPFFDKNNSAALLAPDEENYTEMPLGESFFPSPKITYGRVTVKNLPREIKDTNNTVTSIVKKHATGKVITEFYTSADYPTITDYTDLMSRYDKSKALASILNLNVRDHLTLSQGYSIHTNDMNGKVKSERIYAEGQTSAISGADYIYEETAGQGTASFNRNKGKLNNVITTINAKGNILSKLVGVDYDVINDFRDNKSVTTTAGLNFNTAVLPIGIFVLAIPTIIPSFSRHENQIKIAVTTKVIHTSAILREKRVYDAGAMVSTKNLAWDADTGQVLLTETVNEYKDKYYSLNFPAYWSYSAMKQSASNLDLEWNITKASGSEGQYQFLVPGYSPANYLTPGDELWVVSNTNTKDAFKAYVTQLDGAKFTLITENGRYVTNAKLSSGKFKIIRSGNRNMQSASMASVTSMTNPLYNGTTALTQLPANLFTSTTPAQFRIVNASAIEYNDTWPAQCECRLPKMRYINGQLVFVYDNDDKNAQVSYNPYVYNIKGNWRPKVSYAYLTGRNSEANPNPRQTGFFNSFSPFYTYDATTTKWVVNTANKAKWTYASEVSQYNPFGFELENRDALGRYSSAIYGYNFKFPVALAANTKYSELAYDGFEDYGFNTCDTTAHFNFNGSLSPNKVSISNTKAHSGRKSLKVSPRNKATLQKQIVPCTSSNN